MKHFLFLLDELPPTRSANGVCVDKVINELLAAGDKVSVVCWGEQTKEGVEVYRIPRKPFDRFVQKYQIKTDPFSKLIFLLGRVYNRIAHVVLLPWWPCESFAEVKQFVKKANELIETKGVTDVVAVSYPGETLVAIKRLKKKHGDKITTVMYPLDVTLSGTRHGSAIEKKISKPFNRKFMINCGKYSNKIIALENDRDKYYGIFPQSLHSKFRVAGIPMLRAELCCPDGATKDRDEIRLTFAGNLFTSVRDPSVLFDAIDQLARRLDKKVFFDLYGKCDEAIEKKLKDGDYKFEFVNHGWVTEPQMNKGLAEADIFVNVGNNSSLIPSKLFVYLSFGKPIIHQCIVDRDACLPYLEKCQNSFIIRENIVQDSEHVDELIDFVNRSLGKVQNTADLFESCTPAYTAQILRDN
ncbi:MAG: hypothetical protein IJE62_01945 [Clostridia bacterium]|nr:hypothetical protein [Clostridia bacterium]